MAEGVRAVPASSVTVELATFLWWQPTAVSNLLRTHVDDGSGNCRACKAGAQRGYLSWPCTIHDAATKARDRRRMQGGHSVTSPHSTPSALDHWRREIAEMPYEPLLRLDLDVPNLGRAYNYVLGGRDHFEVDRHAVDALDHTFPGLLHDLARDGREFLRRGVQHLVGEAGIRQLIDPPCGPPIPRERSGPGGGGRRIGPPPRTACAGCRKRHVGGDSGETQISSVPHSAPTSTIVSQV